MTPVLAPARDIRDPEALGLALLALKARYPNETASQRADRLEAPDIPSFDEIQEERRRLEAHPLRREDLVELEREVLAGMEQAAAELEALPDTAAAGEREARLIAADRCVNCEELLIDCQCKGMT